MSPAPKYLRATVAGQKVRVPLWSDAEYLAAEEMARSIGRSFDDCPTCKGTRIETDESDHHGWINGQYRYQGEIHECDCQGQKTLFRHYLGAGIPLQYMRLNWADYDGDETVKADVMNYVKRWPNFRDNGMGVTLYAHNLGVGKTFAATTIAKEVLKRGERVYFTSFRDLRDARELLTAEDRQELDRRTREASLLVLDEVSLPTSDAQGAYFERVLESLIRHRTNWNLPTVLTTNLDEADMLHHYPRVSSLLSAKQWVMRVGGDDQRYARMAFENVELAANGEVRPIV